MNDKFTECWMMKNEESFWHFPGWLRRVWCSSRSFWPQVSSLNMTTGFCLWWIFTVTVVTVNLQGYNGQWHHRVPKTCWAWTPENWPFHAVRICSWWISIFPIILPASHFFRFHEFHVPKISFAPFDLPRSFPSQRVSQALACKVWSLSPEIPVRGRPSHSRCAVGWFRGMFSSFSTNLWHLTRGDILSRSLTQKFRKREGRKCWSQTIMDDLHLATQCSAWDDRFNCT